MKTILTSILLFIFSLTPAIAAEQSQNSNHVRIMGTKEICVEFGNMGAVLMINYLITKASKDQQLNTIRTKIYPKHPVIEGFEPGIVRILTAIDRSKLYLSKLSTDQYGKNARIFAEAVYTSCTKDGANGWIKATKQVKPFSASQEVEM